MSDGKKLLEEAKKAQGYKSFFGGNKQDDAQSLFGRAGNTFKLAKQCTPRLKIGKESGDAYLQQGETLEKMGDKYEASTAYLNAANSLKKEFPKEALEALRLAVAILTEMGKFTAAAKNQKAMAEIYEKDIVDYEAAMDAYDRAGEWYSGEDSNAQANECFLKVAQFAATLEQYDRAINIYESVAEKSLANNLTKWSVREYLLKSAICVLCTGDSVRITTSLERYTRLDPSFVGTRECGLVTALAAAVEAQDGESFTSALQEFDRMTKLDDWKTTLLLRVKKAIEADEEDYT